MKSNDAARAGFSLCMLVLISVLSVPLLLWPRISLAFFPAPLSPLFVGVDPNNYDASCVNGEVWTTNPNYTPCGGPIAYVFTTQVPGTLGFFWGAYPDSSDGCFGGGVLTTDANTFVQCSNIFGYIYPNQVSGTAALFIGVDPNSPDGCFGGGVLTTNSQLMRCGPIVGYVYQSIPAPTQFTVYPTYIIGSVDYAPPGAGSTVTYASTAVTGTTVTTESTWSKEHTEKVGIASLNASVTFGDTFGGTNTHQVDMQTTVNSGVSFPGAPADLINHDYDRINIFLGVNVNGSVDYLGHVTTTIDFSHVGPNFSEDGYNIWVGCLNGHFASSDCGVLTDLNRAGATEADYPAILCADPFADPSCPQPDPARYVFLISKGYSKSQGTQNFSQMNSTTITNSTKTTYSHSVSAQADSPPGADIPMTVTGKLTWTYSSTTSNKTGNTDLSQFNILPPIVDNGLYTLQVYMDTIWKTFMFKLVQ